MHYRSAACVDYCTSHPGYGISKCDHTVVNGEGIPLSWESRDLDGIREPMNESIIYVCRCAVVKVFPHSTFSLHGSNMQLKQHIFYSRIFVGQSITSILFLFCYVSILIILYENIGNALASLFGKNPWVCSISPWETSWIPKDTNTPKFLPLVFIFWYPFLRDSFETL